MVRANVVGMVKAAARSIETMAIILGRLENFFPGFMIVLILSSIFFAGPAMAKEGIERAISCSALSVFTIARL